RAQAGAGAEFGFLPLGGGIFAVSNLRGELARGFAGVGERDGGEGIEADHAAVEAAAAGRPVHEPEGSAAAGQDADAEAANLAVPEHDLAGCRHASVGDLVFGQFLAHGGVLNATAHRQHRARVAAPGAVRRSMARYAGKSRRNRGLAAILYGAVWRGWALITPLVRGR